MLCLFLALFIVQGVFVFVVFESSLVGKRSVISSLVQSHRKQVVIHNHRFLSCSRKFTAVGWRTGLV